MVVRAENLLGGRYRLGDLLGRGGMAEVYDAVDERLDRRVAVKVLRPTMALRPDVRRRFETEARSAARLSHPNAVAVFDTGEDGDVPWLVMERLPGDTLADRMRDGPLDPTWVTKMAGDVLGALGAAHAAGLVHRDVKPGNILLDESGCAKVADFGIAKSTEVADDHTATGQLVGTPAYLAPEQIDGEPASVRTDLYALGVVLYEALSGRKPFEGSTPVGIAHAVRTTTPPPLSTIRADPRKSWRAIDGNQRRAVVLGVLALAIVVLLGMLVASRGEAGGLEADLRDAAEDTTEADGPAAPAAADRLRALASTPDDPAAANALLTELANWRATGGLTAAAADRMRAVVVRVPGADPAAYAPTTTTTLVAPAAASGGDAADGDRDKGRAKKRDRDDDD